MLCELGKLFAKTAGLIVLSAVFMGFASVANAADPPQILEPDAAMQITMTGFRANEGGGGGLDTGWVTGNLGNTWSEGEWVPYQMIIDNIAPGLAELDSIVLSFDFYRSSGSTEARFVDMVRSIQVGSTQLLNTQGWPQNDMSPYPMTTRGEIEIAQNSPGENLWPGFAFLNLPHSQINRAKSDASSDTFPGEDEHTIRIFESDLLAAGVNPNATTVIIYFQLHESRSFIWENGLQAGYDQPPTDDWGGYLYSLPGWSTAGLFGSGYVPGSSGHVRLITQSGNKEVPIPIPERLPGAVSGLKWLDLNANGVQDGLEPPLSGWEIHVFGEVDQIQFTTSTLTDEFGQYSFPNLTNGIWTLKEDSQRDVPPEIGYTQTYPTPGVTLGQGTGLAVAPPPAGVGDNGWEVELTLEITEQADMNFGNRLCDLMCNVSPADTTICEGETATFTDYTTGGTPPYSYCWEMGPTYVGVCISTSASLVIPNAQLSDDGIYRVITTDVNGCADTCFVSLTVNETPVCSIDGVLSTCPSTTNEHCGPPGMTTYEWSISGNGTFETPPTTSDDCVDVVAGALCDSTYTLTLTITNEYGCTSTCEKTVLVNDDEDPVIVQCAADTTFECLADVVLPDNSWAGFVGAGGVATDNCDTTLDVSYVEGDPSGTCPTTIDLTWTVTDDCGNTDTCVQTITIDDTTDPVITSCAADTTFECLADVVLPDNSWAGFAGAGGVATDNCDTTLDASYVEGDPSGTCPTTIELTWTITDDCGNTDTCVQTITVDDTTDPVIASCAADTTFECLADVVLPDNSWAGFVGAGGSATDNCDRDLEASYVEGDPSGTCPTTIELTWTVTDDCNNTDTCVQTITIDDTTDPVITSCAADTTFECLADVVLPDNSWAGFVGAGGVATDNCDTTLDASYVEGDPSGTCPTTIELTWTVTDDCGNTDTCVQTITVDDTTDPVIASCAADTTFECLADVVLPDNSWAGFAGAGGVATDNCDTTLDASYVEGDPSGTCPTTIDLTWTVTDDCGNTDTCVQTITIDDTTDPVITSCAADTMFECFADVVLPDNSWAGFVGAGGAATDNCDTTLDASYVEGPPVGTCATTIELTWTVTDDCNNTDTCVQTITVDDTTAPVIETCPADTSFECGPEPDLTADQVAREDWKFPGSSIAGFIEFGGSARDNCDSELEASYVLSGPVGTCPKVWTLTWTVTDDCNNSDTCVQTISEDDTTPPNIACADTLWFECDDEITGFDDPEVDDACDPSPTVTFEDTVIVGQCAHESTIVRTWTATDSCDNSASCSQVMIIRDTTAPTLICAPDDTVSCTDFTGFTRPTVEDNCDPSPRLIVVDEDTIPGGDNGEILITRCWVAEDDCGNRSDMCCQSILVGLCPCTYTQGGWGSGCPDSQADRTFSTQPGCIRDHFFDQVFPNGVIIGDPAGPGAGDPTYYAALWTSSAAVEAFLPAGGKPMALTGDATNPTDTSAGVLAGQILALTLNREYSCFGVFEWLGLTPPGFCLGDFVIPERCGKFGGLTIDEFLEIANMAIGGMTSVLDPYSAKLADVNYTATCLNERFDDCEVRYAQGIPASPQGVPVDDVDLAPNLALAPVQFTVPQAYPNPFTHSCNIKFGLPRDGRVLIDVFDVAGRRVITLHDEVKPAGFHTVKWDGRNSSGSKVANGIYFYRVKYEDKAEIKKMIMLQ